MALPEACALCEPYEGNWRWNERRAGLERCDCARGLALQSVAVAQQRRDEEAREGPGLAEIEAKMLVDRLTVIPFMPKEPGARLALAEMFMDMVDTYEHGLATVKKVIASYPKFPGPCEIRATYCSLFPPRDGVKAISAVYPENDYPGLPPVVAPMKQLPAGAVSKGYPELEGGIQKLLAAPKAMPDPKVLRLSPEERKRFVEVQHELAVLTPPDQRKGPDDTRLFEVEMAIEDLLPKKKRQSDLVRLHPEDDFDRAPRPPGSYRPITQAEIEAEVAKLRARKAG